MHGRPGCPVVGLGRKQGVSQEEEDVDKVGGWLCWRSAGRGGWKWSANSGAWQRRLAAPPDLPASDPLQFTVLTSRTDFGTR